MGNRTVRGAERRKAEPSSILLVGLMALLVALPWIFISIVLHRFF